MNYLTKQGLDKLKEKLKYLKTVKRPEISEKIGEARDHGDISENAEYHSAKEEQEKIESEISNLEKTIANSKLLDENMVDGTRVQILTTVKLKNINTNNTVKYTIVPEEESDLKKGKISNNTPIAKALIGREKGEQVEINVPAGKMNFEILEINV